jgi:hypothetical protein
MDCSNEPFLVKCLYIFFKSVTQIAGNYYNFFHICNSPVFLRYAKSINVYVYNVHFFDIFFKSVKDLSHVIV